MFNISIDSTKSDAISELDRRLKNPFWSGFAIAWITWNWRVWYLTFFVSETLVGNKIAEIQRMYEYKIFDFFPFLHALPGMILNWIFIPILISAGITFWLPKLTDKFLEKQKKNKENEDKILRSNIKSQEQNIKAEIDLIKAERSKFEAEKKKQISELEKLMLEKENKIKEEALDFAKKELEKGKSIGKKTEQEIWDEEYSRFIEMYPSILDQFSRLSYTYKGDLYDYGKVSGDISNVLKAIDIYALGERSGNTVHNTPKGKYFLRKNEENRR